MRAPVRHPCYHRPRLGGDDSGGDGARLRTEMLLYCPLYTVPCPPHPDTTGDPAAHTNPSFGPLDIELLSYYSKNFYTYTNIL